MRYYRFLLLFGIAGGILMLSSCSKNKMDLLHFQQLKVVDNKANKATKCLYFNLKKIAPDHILFGQQDALAYGVGWKDHHDFRSDVNDVCGSFPAVFGWDVGRIGRSEYNLDSVKFDNMKKWMCQVYERGGINTVSWHIDNLFTGSHSWDVGEKVVASILPGGEKHDLYLAKLDALANLFDDLKVGGLFKKTKVPIVFRPFHEHTGSWFWWGQPHCTPEEYKELFRFTVRYLRDKRGLHNILYCYSPDVVRDREHYLECYPGDDYVDILGLDDYHDVNPLHDQSELTRRLKIVVELAEEKDKLAAMTETGYEAIPQSDWWTTVLLNSIKADPVASKVAWVLVWRNYNHTHHYAPHPGHESVPDFIKFINDPMVTLINGLPELYTLKKKKK